MNQAQYPPVLTEYAVGAPPGAPAPVVATSAKHTNWELEQHYKKMKAGLVFAVVVLTIILLVYVVRKCYNAPANCSKYDGAVGAACGQLKTACDGNSRCNNAIARCMPVMEAITKSPNRGDPSSPAGMASYLGAVSGKQLSACVSAITRVDPKYAAKILSKSSNGMACVPPDASTLFSNDANYNAMMSMTSAAASIIPYSLKVGRELPACAPPASS